MRPSLLGTHVGNGQHGGNEGEGTAKEDGHLPLGNEVKDNGTNTCADQGDGGSESGNDGHEDVGAHHGEEMLNTKDGIQGVVSAFFKLAGHYDK